jgi:hypothetical protein
MKLKYEIGDIICSKNKLVHKSGDQLRISFQILNEKANDPYEYGYQKMERYRNKKLIETLKLRNQEDAYWSKTPFVLIRKMKYLADLDNDGFDEFAILPYHPGSAVFGTVRIFSLKKKIEFWGEGRYHIEGSGHVLLNRISCSKMDLSECNKCE